MQVGSKHQWVVFIVGSQHCPIREPARLWIGRTIPERRLGIGIRTMLIQNNEQTYVSRIIDNLIHQGQPTQPLQIRIQAIVNANRIATRIKKLVRVGKTNGIILQALDLIEHTYVATSIQPPHRIIGCFKAKPIDTSDAYRTILLIHKLRTIGMPMALPDGRRVLLR